MFLKTLSGKSRPSVLRLTLLYIWIFWYYDTLSGREFFCFLMHESLCKSTMGTEVRKHIYQKSVHVRQISLQHIEKEN